MYLGHYGVGDDNEQSAKERRHSIESNDPVGDDEIEGGLEYHQRELADRLGQVVGWGGTCHSSALSLWQNVLMELHAEKKIIDGKFCCLQQRELSLFMDQFCHIRGKQHAEFPQPSVHYIILNH